MLQKVSIQNFKSLKDVTLELQKVNLLIGPNNSGKSNFLKALEFVSVRLRKFQKDDLTNYTFMHELGEGLNVIFVKKVEGTTKNHSFDVLKYIHDLTGYKAELGGTLKNDINTLKEFSGNIHFGLKDTGPYFPYFANGTEMIWELGNEIASTILYSINPNLFTKPSPIVADNKFIKSDGSNIVAFLDSMKDEFPDVINAINIDLNKCIPEFSDIRLSTVSLNEDDDIRKLYGDKTFKKLGLYNVSQKYIYWADEVSEGVLYFLALLCIVHQPNPPKLLLLEEPEKGIHPRRIHEVMKFIFQLAEDKDIQVIMTSHNEHVLEEFALIPEAVFIFDKDDEGATFVKNLKKDIIEPSNEKAKEMDIEPIDFTDSIGDNWFMGLMGGVPA